MVRSLYSAASGMMAQQTNVDVIANNLANVNTIGYKSQSANSSHFYIRIYRLRQLLLMEKISR